MLRSESTCKKGRESGDKIGLAMPKKLIISFLLFFLLILLGCDGHKDEVTEETIVVRIPPYFDPKLTPGENHCVFEIWWHPPFPAPRSEEVVDICRGAALPNDGVPLVVTLQDAGLITRNGQNQSSLSNLDRLTVRLAEVFEEREKNGVYEPRTFNVENSVALNIRGKDRSYSDLFAIADAVRKSGASSIILMLDGHLSEQPIKPTIVLRK